MPAKPGRLHVDVEAKHPGVETDCPADVSNDVSDTDLTIVILAGVLTSGSLAIAKDATAGATSETSHLLFVDRDHDKER